MNNRITHNTSISGNSLDVFVSVLSSSYLVSILIPSFAFLVVSSFVFGPFVESVTCHLGLECNGGFVENGIIYLLITITLGFVLGALNTSIFKLFAGYTILWRFSLLVNSHRKKALKLSTQIDALAQRIIEIEKSKISNRELGELRDKYYSLVAEYDQSYPYHMVDLLPTSFGNKLRAAETYAQTRYGIDSVTFWPRLIQVIPDTYRSYINQSRNEVSFLLNCSVLSIIFSLVCLVVFINNSSSANRVISLNNIFVYPLFYIVLMIISLILAFLFYFFAKNMVSNFGMMIRSAYDLFRLDLLKHLNLKTPRDSDEEFYMWKNLGELIVLGGKNLDFEKLEYDIKD